MKKVHIKSAMPIYIAAAIWLIAGLLCPKMLLRLPTLLIVAAVSALAGWLSRRIFPGRTIEVQEKIKTGDAALDAEIEAGIGRLEKLKKANDQIDNAGISKNLDRMTCAGEQIFTELGKDKRKHGLVRRFMNYYLPTAEKLVSQYCDLMVAGTKGENVLSTMARIENNLGMIAVAFEKCLGNLYADQELDVDAEIQVMRTMLIADGLIQPEKNDIRKAEKSDDDAKTTLTLGGH